MRIQDAMNGFQSASELFVNAVNEQVRHSGSYPYVLSYAPIASMNPFQRLLYCRATDAGFVVVPTLKFKDLGCVNWDGRSVIHLHWLAQILRDATDSQDAKARIDQFRKILDDWKLHGHKVLWSMHNVLPHQMKFPESEIELRNIVVEKADAIHILSKNSVREAERVFQVPTNKVLHIPHPSYEGWYANISDPVSARLDLGINPGEFVFLQFGSIQSYKGTIELIRAFKKLEVSLPHKRFHLVIAGKPVDREYLADITDITNSVPNMTVIPSAMEERDIQILFNAADVVVAPYIKTLNSGVALLAATFKKPLVAPGYAGLRETFAEDQTLLYSTFDESSLMVALQKSINHRIDESVFRHILTAHKPAKISDLFFNKVKKKLFMNGLD